MRTKISVIAFILALAFLGEANASEIDWPKVEAALGKSASVQGEVHRYGIPRSDLQVTLDGVAIKPALALGGWLGFEPMQDGALVMGDLVLTETEVNPVMSKLLESGIEITALHNHLMRASPATLYMHVHAHGDPIAIATAIHAALTNSKTPFGLLVAPGAPTAPIGLDTDKLDAAIGAKGKVNGGVYQFSVPRQEPITEDGMPIPPAMGTAIAINFQPTGGAKAAITGDFVVTAAELNPMIRTLRANDIEVTAIHNPMLDEKPRLFFVHFWANDDAVKLAKGLQAALAKIAVARS
jgi:hypothetical protein